MCTNTDFMAECFLTVQQNLRIKQVILTGNNTFFFFICGTPLCSLLLRFESDEVK